MEINKILYAFALVILLVGVVGAAQSTLGTFKKGDCVDLVQTCDSCTYNNISSIIYPNGTRNLFSPEVEMERAGTDYNYSTCDFSNALGTYKVNGHGDLAGTDTVWNYYYEVTGTGYALTTSTSLVYLGLMMVLFFVFIINIFFINRLPGGNTQDEYGRIMSISYLKYLRSGLWFIEYILFVAILFLVSNLAFAYLGETLFAETIFVFFRIMLGIAPVIVLVWIGWIWVKLFHDKKMQKLLHRGIFPQGRRMF